MSFDKTFDYTPVAAGLREEKTAVEAVVAKLTEERNVLEAAADYANDIEIVNRKIHLTIELDRNTAQLNGINSVLAEITEIQGLPESKKEDLYYFYTVVGASKQDFMTKILFNHDRALNDEKIAKLRADTTTPAPARVAIAKLYYANYIMLPSAVNALMAVYRYVH